MNMNGYQLSPAHIKEITQSAELLLRDNPELLEDEVLRADMIEGETGVNELLNVIEDARRQACTLAAGVASTIATLDERLGRYERREQRLRELIYRVMTACELRKVELPTATFSIRPGPPKVIVMDEAELPEAYIRTKKEPDKQSIATALKSGESVPGAVLSNQPPTLSIRTT